ncbi:MAG: DUF2878 domain-containing protein [Steroidobacteraceae bacterium]|jgi:hypothetical protein|nr:DUF2878 domain-containing protein [Steroidobacteraceae bacterium]
MSPTARKAVNFIVYQVTWLLGVIAAARGQAALGCLILAAAIAVHLWLAPRRAPEVRLVLAALLVGLLWESLLVSFGLFRYASGNFAAGIAPYWILALWAQFATTLNLSLAWLKGRPLLGVAFGLLGGPLAYYAGFKLGALDSPDLTLALALQGFGYAVFVPLFCALAVRWNGFAGVMGDAAAARPATSRPAAAAALSMARESSRA